MATRYIPHDMLPWASDATYPAGADPWSSQPNKVKPSAAVAAVGHVPETRLIYPHQNWKESKWSDAAIVQAYASLQTWRGYNVLSSTADSIGGYLDTVPATNTALLALPSKLSNGTSPTPAEDLIAVVGDKSGGEFELRWATATGNFSNGIEIPTISDGGGFALPSAVFETQNSAVFASTSDRDVVWSSDALTTLNTVANVVPVGYGIGNLHMSHNGSGRLLAGLYGAAVTTTRIYTSDDGGQTWTGRTVPAGWNATNINAFTDNGNGTILASGNKSGEILRSTDNGVTWAAVAISPSSYTTNYGMAWSPVHGLFMLAGATILVSADGATWTERTGSPTVGTGPTDTRFALGACGPVFALIFNQTMPNAGFTRRGVHVSLDAGLSWHTVTLGRFNSGQITGVREIAGRLVAWGFGKLYVTAPLFKPDPTIVYT